MTFTPGGFVDFNRQPHVFAHWGWGEALLRLHRQYRAVPEWKLNAETLRGLQKLSVNREYCLKELEAHPELLAEPIQTILRREGTDDPYALLKEVTRGHRVTLADLHRLIDGLDIAPQVKVELKALRVSEYTGDAERICDAVITRAEQELGEKVG
jgi:hypothetical protein